MDQKFDRMNQKMGLLPHVQERSLIPIQKNMIETPIVKHPAATQGLKRSPVLRR